MLGDNLTSLAVTTAKGQEKQQLIMIILFENFFCFESSLLVKEPEVLFLEYSFCFDIAQS